MWRVLISLLLVGWYLPTSFSQKKPLRVHLGIQLQDDDLYFAPSLHASIHPKWAIAYQHAVAIRKWSVGVLVFQPSFSVYRVLLFKPQHQIYFFTQGDFHRIPTAVAHQNIVSYRCLGGVSYRFGNKIGGFFNAALGYAWHKITPKPQYFQSNAYNVQVGFWSAIAAR